MATFSEWNQCALFAQRGMEDSLFLMAVEKSAERRETMRNAGQVFWRAQVGGLVDGKETKNTHEQNLSRTFPLEKGRMIPCPQHVGAAVRTSLTTRTLRMRDAR